MSDYLGHVFLKTELIRFNHRMDMGKGKKEVRLVSRLGIEWWCHSLGWGVWGSVVQVGSQNSALASVRHPPRGVKLDNQMDIYVWDPRRSWA